MIVQLPEKTYVDLYDATGLTVGTQLCVTNVTPDQVRVFATAAAPTPSDDFYPVTFRHVPVKNTTGDVGAWALSVTGGAIDVKEVVS